MTIDEAIDVDEGIEEFFRSDGETIYADAVKLGIEALKHYQHRRDAGFFECMEMLPGETKDYCKFCGLAHTSIECPSREGEK